MTCRKTFGDEFADNPSHWQQGRFEPGSEGYRPGMTQHRPPLERAVPIPIPGAELIADVTVPPPARGVVLFAHGSGSGRHSPRNRYVAGELNAAGLATVLVDLLTLDEERADATGRYRFDIDLLAGRVAELVGWAAGHPPLAGLGIGLFGASTGAAAALVAAARQPALVRAVVSRGGRPDLAADHLATVRCPTLLIVGERDEVVLELNRGALARLGERGQLVTVPRATHLFEEPGTLEQVAVLAAGWFAQHVPARPA
jgi:putative phosphoribosyl transferase